MKQQQLFIFAIVVMLFAAFSRLLPHPPNFTPLLAVALFGGAYFDKFWAMLVPLAAMLLSDFALQIVYWTGNSAFSGFHEGLFAVYFAFALIVGIGAFLLKNKVSYSSILGGSLLASSLFFLITNFSVWLFSGFYPLNAAGLSACFVAAIPFFGNTMAATLLYSGALFGSYEWMKSRNASTVNA